VPSAVPSYPPFVPPDNAGELAERISALKGGLLMSARNPLPLGGIPRPWRAIPLLPLASQRAPRGLPTMLAEVGAFDPSDPEAPPSGGLPGLIREYLRNR